MPAPSWTDPESKVSTNDLDSFWVQYPEEPTSSIVKRVKSSSQATFPSVGLVVCGLVVHTCKWKHEWIQDATSNGHSDSLCAWEGRLSKKCTAKTHKAHICYFLWYIRVITFMPNYMQTWSYMIIHAYINKYEHILTYSHTYILKHSHTYTCTYLHIYILTYLHIDIFTFLHTCILP